MIVAGMTRFTRARAVDVASMVREVSRARLAPVEADWAISLPVRRTRSAEVATADSTTTWNNDEATDAETVASVPAAETMRLPTSRMSVAEVVDVAETLLAVAF